MLVSVGRTTCCYVRAADREKGQLVSEHSTVYGRIGCSPLCLGTLETRLRLDSHQRIDSGHRDEYDGQRKTNLAQLCPENALRTRIRPTRISAATELHHRRVDLPNLRKSARSVRTLVTAPTSVLVSTQRWQIPGHPAARADTRTIGKPRESYGHNITPSEFTGIIPLPEMRVAIFTNCWVYEWTFTSPGILSSFWNMLPVLCGSGCSLSWLSPMFPYLGVERRIGPSPSQQPHSTNLHTHT